MQRKLKVYENRAEILSNIFRITEHIDTVVLVSGDKSTSSYHPAVGLYAGGNLGELERTILVMRKEDKNPSLVRSNEEAISLVQDGWDGRTYAVCLTNQERASTETAIKYAIQCEDNPKIKDNLGKIEIVSHLDDIVGKGKSDGCCAGDDPMIATNLYSLPTNVVNKIHKIMPSRPLEEIHDDLLPAFSRYKTLQEIEDYRIACQITQKGFESIFQLLNNSYQEKILGELSGKDLWRHALNVMKEIAVNEYGEMIDLSFGPISGQDPSIHPRTTDERLREWAVMVDLGITFRLLKTDCTRTFLINPPEIQKKIVEMLCINPINNAIAKANERLATGEKLKICELASFVEREYECSKAQELIQWGQLTARQYLRHIPGHGVGELGHQSPVISKWNPDDLESNTTFALESSVEIAMKNVKAFKELKKPMVARHENTYVVLPNKNGVLEISNLTDFANNIKDVIIGG